MKYDLDIVIPVYHEERNITETLKNILKRIKINFRIIVVYDYLEDPTVSEVKNNFSNEKIILLKNKFSGLNGVVKTAFEISDAKAVILYSAEDHQNYDVINKMYDKFNEGYDVVCASRLMAGGDYYKVKEPLIKSILVKIVSYILSNFTSLQTTDPSNGFRLFSNEIIRKFPIESKRGFTFAIELLAKAYRNNYKITEVPSNTPIRKKGKSKFKYKTIIFYLPWFINILFSRINSKNEKN
jgi:glycosyltransferase involved in cell wall biosynthesis|tara:strand:- start:149 stop:868 length:720 start_codon:yes stop_codon:yes gene_type:complete